MPKCKTPTLLLLVNTVAFVTCAASESLAFGSQILDIGIPGYRYSSVNSLSGDGRVAAGAYYNDTQNARAFRWSLADGAIDLGEVPAPFTRSVALGISDDGSTVAGYLSYDVDRKAKMMRWSPVSGVENLGSYGVGLGALATAVSGDGLVIIGDARISPGAVTAFRWTASESFQSLGVLSSHTSSTARAVNGNGSVIVGSSQDDTDNESKRGFLWTEAGGIQELSVLPSALQSQAMGVNSKGDVVVGSSGRTDGTLSFSRAVRWDGGVIESLGVLPGGVWSEATAVDGSGDWIAGVSDSYNGYRRFLWSRSLGMVELESFLIVRGVDIAGWTLEDPKALRVDGSGQLVIAGNGLNNGTSRGFVVSVSVPEMSASGFVAAAALVIGAAGVLEGRVRRGRRLREVSSADLDRLIH